MSALSGITVSTDLASIFANATKDNKTRFIVAAIRDEIIVHDSSIPIKGSLQEDLLVLQDVLQSDIPAYILTKLDLPSPNWVSFYYVPENAKIRDKMLYASSRSSLTKSLGSSLFTDSIFATSKADLTPDSYAAHLRHVASPNPLSSREQELADLVVEENAASSYEGSHVRQTYPGFPWSQEAEDALVDLASNQGDHLLILTVDETESLVVHTASQVNISALGSYFPEDEPCYAILACSLSVPSRTSREIIFIYCCPASSPVRLRMVYASGARSTQIAMKNILATSPNTIDSSFRRIETSDPRSLNEDLLKVELGLGSGETAVSSTKSFPRPRGPPRRR